MLDEGNLGDRRPGCMKELHDVLFAAKTVMKPSSLDNAIARATYSALV